MASFLENVYNLQNYEYPIYVGLNILGPKFSKEYMNESPICCHYCRKLWIDNFKNFPALLIFYGQIIEAKNHGYQLTDSVLNQYPFTKAIQQCRPDQINELFAFIYSQKKQPLHPRPQFDNVKVAQPLLYIKHKSINPHDVAVRGKPSLALKYLLDDLAKISVLPEVTLARKPTVIRDCFLESNHGWTNQSVEKIIRTYEFVTFIGHLLTLKHEEAGALMRSYKLAQLTIEFFYGGYFMPVFRRLMSTTDTEFVILDEHMFGPIDKGLYEQPALDKYTQSVDVACIDIIKEKKVHFDQVSENPKTLIGLLFLLTDHGKIYNEQKELWEKKVEITKTSKPVQLVLSERLQKFELYLQITRYLDSQGEHLMKNSVISAIVILFKQPNILFKIDNSFVIDIPALLSLSLLDLQEIIVMITMVSPDYKF